MPNFERSASRIREGASVLARGVGSDFRLGMSPHPLVFDRAEGPYVFDIDGNRLIDYYLGMGPMILGHNPPEVVEAVRRSLDNGILFAGQSEIEYEAAELVCEMVPCADRVRFASSGSEAVQAAMRLARAATGRWKVIKFEGHYHGWFDNVLWSTGAPADKLGPRDRPVGVAGSEGQDPAGSEQIKVLPWNDLDEVRGALGSGDVAAVIMEPAMCNASAIPPSPGYLEGVREACTKAGTVLIFDEVITGFRLSKGGAQELFGVTPDLAVFGKALASGFPVAALAGRSDLMEMLGIPAGGTVMHAGTYNGGVPAMAATVATLKQLRRDETWTRLRQNGERLRKGLSDSLASIGANTRVEGWPPVFHVALGVHEPVVDYRSSLATDKPAYVKLCIALLERGVRCLERGAWFVSTTHDADVADETISAFQDALQVI